MLLRYDRAKLPLVRAQDVGGDRGHAPPLPGASARGSCRTASRSTHALLTCNLTRQWAW